MLRLSFIVPFYNVEPYIEECIRSLYAQDIPWEEYEVICVDDCSPDSSRVIVERLQKEYPTLKLLTTPKNLRQGGARNMGLDVAQGKYICFVDSDDYIKTNCMRYLLNQMEEENLDILDFDFESGEYGRKKGMVKNQFSYSMGVCSGTEYVFDHRSRWANKCCSVCAMIICKSFLDENNLRFVEKMQYEDTDFSMRMFANAKRVKHIGGQFYYYRYTSESTTHNIVCIQKIYYRVELVKRYINLLDCLDQHQWQTAIRELIKYDVYTVLRDLRQLKLLQQYYFYRRQLGNIIGIDKFVGKRSLLALKHWFLLYVFY